MSVVEKIGGVLKEDLLDIVFEGTTKVDEFTQKFIDKLNDEYDVGDFEVSVIIEDKTTTKLLISSNIAQIDQDISLITQPVVLFH